MDPGHPHPSHHHQVVFGDLGRVVQEVDEDMCWLPDGNFKVRVFEFSVASLVRIYLKPHFQENKRDSEFSQ